MSNLQKAIAELEKLWDSEMAHGDNFGVAESVHPYLVGLREIQRRIVEGEL